ncbi:MAG TPA: hypothetical protein PKD24_10480 [Pyrinomonadaceae bacterium]|nr:hypothetical protein [Pyrinomonadaceae bacterium]HMP65352.1 hypothetical protein [Pyrinomonadaceae bacterium]
MLDARFSYITEEFFANHVTPDGLDKLLADGWRHFGSYFFRYNLAMHRDEIRLVTPLRIRLSDLVLSKSQRRNLRRNADLRIEVGPLRITSAAEDLFQKHKERFVESTPGSILNFVPASFRLAPCDTRQISVFDADRLVAESYFDVGTSSASGIYGMFDPEVAARGLGIFTLLKEMEFGSALGLQHYYLGYSYSGRSFYDYKKRFAATEYYNWRGEWLPFSFVTDERSAQEPFPGAS